MFSCTRLMTNKGSAFSLKIFQDQSFEFLKCGKDILYWQTKCHNWNFTFFLWLKHLTLSFNQINNDAHRYWYVLILSLNTGVKQDISPSSFTVLIYNQSNLAWVKLWQRPTLKKNKDPLVTLTNIPHKFLEIKLYNKT